MQSDRPSPKGSATRPVLRVERGIATSDDDRLAEEVPIAMHVDGDPFAVMMATPLDLEDFARGFALTEGRVGSIDDIERIDVHGNGKTEGRVIRPKSGSCPELPD